MHPPVELTADIDALTAGDESSLPETAIRLAEAGFKVIALKPKSKRPQPWAKDPDNGAGGVHAATTDIGTVKDWWTREADSNIGVVPGWSGFIVCDIDGPRGKKTWTTQFGQSLNRGTVIVTSPGKGGGLHHWFRLPTDTALHPKGRVGLGDGVEGIAFGQYIVVPPSLHPAGGKYATTQTLETVTVPSLPSAVLTALSDVRTREGHAGVMLPISDAVYETFVAERSLEPSTPNGLTGIQDAYDRLISTQSGERNITLTSVIGSITRNQEINLAEALDALWEAWQIIHPGPLSKHEWSRTVRSVCRYPATEQSAPVEVVSEYQVRSLTDIPTRKVEWLLEGWVPLRYCTMLYGDGGKGKSLWVAWLGSKITADGDAVVVFTHEDQPSTTLGPRWEAAGANPKLVFVPNPAQLSGLKLTDGGSSLAGYVEAVTDASGASVRLVVLDPIADYLAGADTHKDSELRQKVFRQLSALAEDMNLAVVYVSHTRKYSTSGDGSAKAAAIGSVAFSNVARSAILLGDDPTNTDTQNLARRAVASTKLNFGKPPPPQIFEIADREILLSDGHVGRYPYMRPIRNEPNVTASDIWAATVAKKPATAVPPHSRPAHTVLNEVASALVDYVTMMHQAPRSDVEKTVGDAFPQVSKYQIRKTVDNLLNEGQLISQREGWQAKTFLFPADHFEGPKLF